MKPAAATNGGAARNLEGYVALVTGSGRGVGRGIALRVASDGARVVVNGTTSAAVEETVELIRAEGNEPIGLVADVRSEPEVARLVEAVVQRMGGLHILVNNAGVNRDAMFEKMTEAQWDDVLDVNLKGPWLCAKHAAAHMREAGYGRVVNIGAEAGLFGNMGIVNYVAAKAGLIGLTMTIARELGRWAKSEGSDLTCNLVFPGFNATRMTDGIPDNVREMLLDQITLGRIADARSDVGAVVSFLASPDARYVTGSKISANGGLHMNLAT